MSDYDVNSIKSLSQIDSIRLKPSMYIGTTSQDGINQLVYEIWDNSLDEYSAGYGNEIDVFIDKDNYITIKDHGRGVPADLHPEWKNLDGTPMYTLTGIFTKIHAGGKLFADGTSGYFSTVGVFGVGSTAVNCLSDYFEVTSCRDNKIYNQKFSKGEPISNVEIMVGSDQTGTTIKFHPDPTIFKSTIQPNDKKLRNRLDEITSLNVNLKVNYKNELAKTEEEFYYPNGISDYIKNKLLKEKPLLFDNPIYYKDKFIKDNEFVDVEFSFIYTDEVESNEIIKTFANNVSTKEHGTHLQGFKEGFKEAINQYAINKKWISEPIEIKYLMDNICLIVSVKLRECELDGQTKNKLGNILAKEGVAEIVKKYFEKLDKEQQNIIQTIIERANKVKEAEEAARRARINTRKANQIKKMALPGKLADCGNTKGYTELFMCEGLSAAGSAKDARYREFQAVLPLRGKILNVEKTGFEKMINSEVIKSLIASIGTGIGKHFDISKCRYDKVILMTDADRIFY